MICDLLALRPISHITKKTLSYLHSTKIEQMTETMVILKEAPFFFAAFAAIQYHHKLPSSGSRILVTLPLAVISNCHDCSERGELEIGDVLNHSGAPNDDLPLNTLKTLLRLPRVLLDL